jgi:hypothetical protein
MKIMNKEQSENIDRYIRFKDYIETLVRDGLDKRMDLVTNKEEEVYSVKEFFEKFNLKDASKEIDFYCEGMDVPFNGLHFISDKIDFPRIYTYTVGQRVLQMICYFRYNDVLCVNKCFFPFLSYDWRSVPKYTSLLFGSKSTFCPSRSTECYTDDAEVYCYIEEFGLFQTIDDAFSAAKRDAWDKIKRAKEACKEFNDNLSILVNSARDEFIKRINSFQTSQIGEHPKYIEFINDTDFFFTHQGEPNFDFKFSDYERNLRVVTDNAVDSDLYLNEIAINMTVAEMDGKVKSLKDKVAFIEEERKRLEKLRKED